MALSDESQKIIQKAFAPIKAEPRQEKEKRLEKTLGLVQENITELVKKREFRIKNTL